MDKIMTRRAASIAVLCGMAPLFAALACGPETGPTTGTGDCPEITCSVGCVASRYYSLTGSSCDCDPILDPPPGGCQASPAHRDLGALDGGGP
jgi:hypothetical protein